MLEKFGKVRILKKGKYGHADSALCKFGKAGILKATIRMFGRVRKGDKCVQKNIKGRFPSNSSFERVPIFYLFEPLPSRLWNIS